MSNKPPLKDFADQMAAADNKTFTSHDGFPLIVGQKVRGSWVNYDGKTYYCEGEISYNENSGFFVTDKDGGITPIKLFFFLTFDNAE